MPKHYGVTFHSNSFVIFHKTEAAIDTNVCIDRHMDGSIVYSLEVL